MGDWNHRSLKVLSTFSLIVKNSLKVINRTKFIIHYMSVRWKLFLAFVHGVNSTYIRLWQKIFLLDLRHLCKGSKNTLPVGFI